MKGGRSVAIAIIVILAGASLVSIAPPAVACSCAPLNIREGLAAADAAFVGVRTNVEVRSDNSSTLVSTFQVERDIRGNLEDEIYVIAGQAGGACGLQPPDHRPIGFLLRLGDEGWHSSLCEQVNADQLMRVAAEMSLGPRPITGPTGKPDVELSNQSVAIGLVVLAAITAIIASLAVRRRQSAASPQA